MAENATKAAAAATDAAQTATDAATQAANHAETAQAAADAATLAKAAVDEHASAIMQAAQELANSPAPSAPYAKPSASILTNAYAFNQAVKWLSSVAASAADLESLQSFLRDLALGTQDLVDAIDNGERQTLSRIVSGVPRVGGDK